MCSYQGVLGTEMNECALKECRLPRGTSFFCDLKI
jgi:hypothetical protein